MPTLQILKIIVINFVYLITLLFNGNIKFRLPKIDI